MRAMGEEVMGPVAAQIGARTFRLAGSQVLVTALGAFLGGLVGFSLASFQFGDLDRGHVLLSALALAAGFAVGARSRKVTANDDHVAVPGFAGRVIAWSNVDAIEHSRFLGVRCLTIVENSGWRTRLPVPVDGRFLMHDRSFRYKARSLEDALARSRQAQI